LLKRKRVRERLPGLCGISRAKLIADRKLAVLHRKRSAAGLDELFAMPVIGCVRNVAVGKQQNLFFIMVLQRPGTTQSFFLHGNSRPKGDEQTKKANGSEKETVVFHVV
jgi:hypothetical protein